MADLSQIKPHMQVIGADGAKIGTVDSVEGDRIKLVKADSGSHSGHHHYLSGGLVSGIEGETVRLSANGDAAVLLEEEAGGEFIADKGSVLNWKNAAIGAAAVGAVAAGAVYLKTRAGGSDEEKQGGDGPQGG